MEYKKRKPLDEVENVRETSKGRRQGDAVCFNPYDYPTGNMQDENTASTSKDLKSCVKHVYKSTHHDEDHVPAFTEYTKVQNSETNPLENAPKTPKTTDGVKEKKAKYEKKEKIQNETPKYEDAAYSETMLWITNVSYGTPASKLVEIVSTYGKVQEANVLTNANDPSGCSVGFIRMETCAQADICVQNLNNSRIGDRTITIQKKRPSELNLPNFDGEHSQTMLLNTEKTKATDKQLYAAEEMSERDRILRSQLKDELYKELMQENARKIEKLERDQKRLRYERGKLERDKAKFAEMQKKERDELETERMEFERMKSEMLADMKRSHRSHDVKKSNDEFPPYDLSRYKIDEADLENTRHVYTKGPLVHPSKANVRDPRIQKNLGLPPSRDSSPFVDISYEYSHVPPKCDMDSESGNKSIPVIDGSQSVNPRHYSRNVLLEDNNNERGGRSETRSDISNTPMWDDTNQGVDLQDSFRSFNIENLHYITPSFIFQPGAN